MVDKAKPRLVDGIIWANAHQGQRSSVAVVHTSFAHQGLESFAAVAHTFYAYQGLQKFAVVHTPFVYRAWKPTWARRSCSTSPRSQVWEVRGWRLSLPLVVC